MPSSTTQTKTPQVGWEFYRGANLSPFGEIRRFHLEIGHSRESCRSVKKIFEERRGGVVVGSASHLCHVTCSVFSPCWQWQEWTCPTLSLIGLPWGRSPHRCCLLFSLWPRKELKILLSVLIVQIRIRYHLKLQRVSFYFCIVIITTK